MFCLNTESDSMNVMRPFFTKTFVRFFVGFVVIIGLAFGVLVATSQISQPIDNVAAPR